MLFIVLLLRQSFVGITCLCRGSTGHAACNAAGCASISLRNFLCQADIHVFLFRDDGRPRVEAGSGAIAICSEAHQYKSQDTHRMMEQALLNHRSRATRRAQQKAGTAERPIFIIAETGIFHYIAY